MPVDPRLLGQIKPVTIAHPLDVVAGMQRIRSAETAQEQAAQQTRLGAQAEQMNVRKMAAEDRELALDAAGRQLFSGAKPPTEAQVYSLYGPKLGAEVMKFVNAANVDKQNRYASTQELIRDAVAGLDALPEPTRAAKWPEIRRNLVGRGLVRPEELPEAYDSSSWQAIRGYGQAAITPYQTEALGIRRETAKATAASTKTDDERMAEQARETARHNRVMESKPPATGAERSPYFIPVQTGEGIIPFNTRTGAYVEPNRKDLRPSATAEVDLTRAQSTLYQIKEIRNLFTPERAGPLKGRYKTMQLALVGELGDRGLADFQSATATLGNTVIQLRTGAQMSEQEAQRILKEIPNMNLPPDVFLARLGRAEDYFQEWYRNRAKLAFGRTTKGDVDVMVAPKPGTNVPNQGTPAPGGGAKADPMGIR